MDFDRHFCKLCLNSGQLYVNICVELMTSHDHQTLLRDRDNNHFKKGIH